MPCDVIFRRRVVCTVIDHAGKELWISLCGCGYCIRALFESIQSAEGVHFADGYCILCKSFSIHYGKPKTHSVGKQILYKYTSSTRYIALWATVDNEISSKYSSLPEKDFSGLLYIQRNLLHTVAHCKIYNKNTRMPRMRSSIARP